MNVRARHAELLDRRDVAMAQLARQDVCVDTALVDAVIRAALPHLGDDIPAVFLPTQTIGFSPEHAAFGGTLTLKAETLIRLWTDIGESVAATGVRKLVLMTAMGANADEAAPLRKAEVHLIQSGLAYNIIRPNWFMQNFNTFWLHGILNGGTIALPVGQAKGSFIDARDIAAVAAAPASSLA